MYIPKFYIPVQAEQTDLRQESITVLKPVRQSLLSGTLDWFLEHYKIPHTCVSLDAYSSMEMELPVLTVCENSLWGPNLIDFMADLAYKHSEFQIAA